METANVASAGKILAYDGDCSMCEAMSALPVRLRLIPASGRRPFQTFTGDMAGRLAAAGIRNEMAVVEPATGEMRMGIPGILWLLRDTSAGSVARALDKAWIRPALTAVYRLISYNRRVLAPPRSGIVCACDPDPRPAYQIALIGLLLLFTCGMTALFGGAVAAGTGIASPLQGALWMLLAAGSGWVLLCLAAFSLPRDLRLRFLGHLGMVMAAGLIVLVPSMLLSLAIQGPWLAAAFGSSATASFLLMARSWRRRLRFLGLSPAWLVGWAAALWTGAAASAGLFYLR